MFQGKSEIHYEWRILDIDFGNFLSVGLNLSYYQRLLHVSFLIRDSSLLSDWPNRTRSSGCIRQIKAVDRFRYEWDFVGFGLIEWLVRVNEFELFSETDNELKESANGMTKRRFLLSFLRLGNIKCILICSIPGETFG